MTHRMMVLILAVLASACSAAEYKQSTLHFKNVPGIESISFESSFYGYNSAVNRPLTGGELAYDYSAHLIKDGDVYRMYAGGRWKRPDVKNADGDHVMQYVSKTGAAGTWKMPRNRPEFWIGAEDGQESVWYSGNCLEPEVVKVKGKYYMYTQVEIGPDTPIDLPGKKSTGSADRIVLFTSTNGTDWTRMTERGVVVNVEYPLDTPLHHEEMLYVPWDKDNRPFWMYVAYNEKGAFKGYCRIRSADPTTFDWKLREPGVGFAQLGNQCAYAKQAPGGPLFVRITFTGDKAGRTVPSLQFSRDGIGWSFGDDGPVQLDGSRDNTSNKNCYFLGISTIDGTGELEYLGGNKFRALYAATTCNTAVAPEIFNAEIGVGELIFTIEPKSP